MWDSAACPWKNKKNLSLSLSLTPLYLILPFCMCVWQCVMSEKDRADKPVLSLSIVSDSILHWGQYHTRPVPFQYWCVCPYNPMWTASWDVLCCLLLLAIPLRIHQALGLSQTDSFTSPEIRHFISLSLCLWVWEMFWLRNVLFLFLLCGNTPLLRFWKRLGWYLQTTESVS